jgi:hypothetical protein
MPLTQQAQAVVDAFGQQPGVTPQQLQNLQRTIDASPALTQEVNNAVAQQHLQRIVPLNNPHAGGEYNAQGHEMRLPLSMLNSPAAGHYDSGEATFVLGHELQHGFNAATVQQARDQFARDLTAVATSPGHDHDYTTAIGTLIAAQRRDEAGAEISGWNAVVSAAQKEAADQGHPAPTLADIYNRQPFRMGDFIDVDRSHMPPLYTLKPNLHVDGHLHMDATASNVEGMGKNYFDGSGGLGHNGNSNYANYYGASAIGDAVRFERYYNPPQPGVPGHPMSLDMQRLHLSPSVVAQNGIDLGSDTRPMPYLDKSTQPPTPAQFRHTATTHTYQPLEPNAQAQPGKAHLDHADHPDHALYQQALAAVHRLDAERQRAPDQYSNNLAASLTVAARREGMNEIHHVMLSDDSRKAFGVQGELRSPLKHIAQVDTEQAVNTSVVQSSQAWQQVMQNSPSPSLQASAPQQDQHGMAPRPPM